jgi:hypothetical protein
MPRQVINSAVFNGGFLTGGTFFDYREVTPALNRTVPQRTAPAATVCLRSPRWRRAAHLSSSSSNALFITAVCEGVAWRAARETSFFVRNEVFSTKKYTSRTLLSAKVPC